MAEDEGMFNLATIMKIAGSVPILLGIMIILNPTGSLVNGELLSESGVMVGRYVVSYTHLTLPTTPYV